MSVLGGCFAFLLLGVQSLVVLCIWKFFHLAASPYPMLVNVLVVLAFHKVVGGRTQRFFAGAVPLELYHTPKWFLKWLRSASRGMGTTHLIEEKALKAAAEQRAARLRAQIMVLDNNAGGSGQAPTSPAAASAEAHTRRHLRVVAMSS